jgi:hypothetical protein
MHMKQKLKIVALILAVAACAIAAIGGTVLVGRLAERLFDAWTAPPPKPHTFAATPIQGPPNPVYLADGVTSSANLLGVSNNPLYVIGGTSPEGGSGAIVANSPAVTVLGTSGSVPVGGLNVVPDGGCNVTSVKYTNNTTGNIWCWVANSATFQDAGFTGMIDTLTLVPATSQVVLGTDHYGTAGVFYDAGCSPSCSATGIYDAGAGVFTPVASALSLEVKGYTP